MRRVALLVGREPDNRYSVHRGYADAVWAVGAVPVLLTPPPGEGLDGVDAYVATALVCDAVCVTGGGDVDPRLYSEEPEPGLMHVDPARDAAEVAVVRASVTAGMPVLGVCRGAQLVTVSLGGSLHQDLARAGYHHHWQDERQHEPVHGVEAAAGSAADQALGGAHTVNSIHHQAVRDPGTHLRATAWSADGAIEAVEGRDVLGLQWHPERLWTSDARHLAAFRWLVAK
jgi:putative glutamine amidotransferase